MISLGGIRFGLVGAGAIAQSYVQAIEECEGAELVAVADVREEAAAAAAHVAGCKSFTSYEEMLRDVPFDAAIVCTPPGIHPEICIRLLESGVHVLCEKPLAVSSEQAAAMLGAAKKSGNKFTMASKFRFVEDVVKAKSIVTSGMIGEVILLSLIHI